jgi:hypothetical protein
MHRIRDTLAAVSVPLRYQGMVVYLFALVGFLVFYGLHDFRQRLRKTAKQRQSVLAVKPHVAGFALYVWMMGYLLVHGLDATRVSTALYAGAIAFHFLSIDHALRDEYGAPYQRFGRFVLAGAALLGWGMGLVVTLPEFAIALLLAFVSGAIIMNSAIMELPSEKDGRFLPFVTGGVVYGAILLPLG